MIYGLFVALVILGYGGLFATYFVAVKGKLDD